MKFCSIFLCLFTACVSSIFAQNGKGTDTQGNRRAMTEPGYSNQRYSDRYAPAMQMDATESINGTMVVTTPNNQRFNLKLVDGSLKTDPKVVRKLADSLRKAQPGDAFSFDLPNGARLEIVRTANGWVPGDNGDISERDPSGAIIIFVVITCIIAWIVT